MIPVSRDSRARRGSIMGSLLRLWALTTQCRYGHGASSSDSELVDSSASDACPAEFGFCMGSSACVGCFDILQGLATSTMSPMADYGDCDAFVVNVCGLVEDAGCDGSSSTLLDLVGCLAGAFFGCSDFSTCDVDTADTIYAASVAPTATESFFMAIPTSAPTISDSSAPSVVAAVVDETLVPTTRGPLSTPAPTAFAVDETLAPTLKLWLPSPSSNEPIEAGPTGNFGHKHTGALTSVMILSAIVPMVVSVCLIPRGGYWKGCVFKR